MECPLARQQHANCPDRLEGNKGDSFSQASEICGLLVVIHTGDGRSHPQIFREEIHQRYEVQAFVKCKRFGCTAA